jgi:hypothetical protein
VPTALCRRQLSAEVWADGMSGCADGCRPSAARLVPVVLATPMQHPPATPPPPGQRRPHPRRPGTPPPAMPPCSSHVASIHPHARALRWQLDRHVPLVGPFFPASSSMGPHRSSTDPTCSAPTVSCDKLAGIRDHCRAAGEKPPVFSLYLHERKDLINFVELGLGSH